MKKNTKLAYAVLGIVFILFNVIAFAVPTDKTITFWIAYAFTFVAFVLQIGIWNAAFTLKSKFLGIPIIYVGIVYLVLQLIAFAVFMIFPLIPSWIVVIACALVLGISAICLISADVARDEVNRAEEKVNQKVFYIRELQADVEMLAEQEQNSKIKTGLTKLAEKIRFSDPMSDEQLSDLDSKISTKVAELKTVSSKLEIITELNSLLDERNKNCKILK